MAGDGTGAGARVCGVACGLCGSRVPPPTRMQDPPNGLRQPRGGEAGVGGGRGGGARERVGVMAGDGTGAGARVCGVACGLCGSRVPPPTRMQDPPNGLRQPRGGEAGVGGGGAGGARGRVGVMAGDGTGAGARVWGVACALSAGRPYGEQDGLGGDLGGWGGRHTGLGMSRRAPPNEPIVSASMLGP